jgi:benzoate-CoA ligase
MSIAPGPPSDFNFAQHLLAINAGRGESLAYLDDTHEITYRELGFRIRRFADAIRRLGIRPEERVLLAMHDSIDWPVAFLGCLYAGIVPVPVNTLLTQDDYQHALQHSGASAAIVSPSLLHLFTQALSQAPHHGCRHLIARGAPPRRPTSVACHSLEELLDSGSERCEGSRTHADGIAFWLYSSGSTGRPKGVVHTHANLYWTSELYAKRVLGLRSDDRIFSAAKLFFAYGLGNALTFPLSVGASAVLMAERPTPSAVFSRLRNRRPTIFCGAPTLYAGLLAAEELPSRSQVNLRLCTSAGEALPKEIGERFTAHFGSEIIDGLGSTEMLHIFISNRPGGVHYGSSGTAVEGYEVEIRDESGRPAHSGDIGDLWVKGPSAALFYWNDQAKSRDTFQGHWIKTGDKYFSNATGHYVYAGRNDDMLKISGQYVSPFEVESTLTEHPLVLESAVIGICDHVGISKCKAYVVLRSGVIDTGTLAMELQAFVKQRLAPFKRPHLVEFVAELPKTATGKIQRFKLRELSRA